MGPSTRIRFTYTAAQEQVFFKTHTRFVVVTKGRRVGITKGAAQAFIEKALTGARLNILWGETIYSNVQRYIDRYFQPHLDKLPDSIWHWSQKIMQLNINGTIIDFRSADNPETWEGFGYHIVFLNEAGIILRNPDLYKKTVLPMLLDYPDSRLIAAGVPKGKKLRNGEVHPFFELWNAAALDTELYTRYRYPTSRTTNPYLSQENIDVLVGTTDPQTKLQEIDGEFIDTTDNPYLHAFEYDKHVHNVEYMPVPTKPIIISWDFNVVPAGCIVAQAIDHRTLVIFDEISMNGTTEDVCNVLLSRYPSWISKGMVTITGDATGKNRNTVSGEVTNYVVIKRVLKLRDYNFKVKTSNSLLKTSQILCNSILHTCDIIITANCKQVISDAQLASVDGTGELENGGAQYHKLACFRYLLEAMFPDILKPSGQKYIKRTTKPAPPLSPIEQAVEDRSKTITKQ